MANVSPATMFSGYSSDGTTISITIADVPGLTAAEADATTGNGAEVLRSILNNAYSNLEGLDDAAQPTQMLWNRPAPQGLGDNLVRQSYDFSFNLQTDPTVLNVVAESYSSLRLYEVQ